MSMTTDMQREMRAAHADLYFMGWRVTEEQGGHRLRFTDAFANRIEDFGLHATADRAWEIAGFLSKPAPAITGTSNA